MSDDEQFFIKNINIQNRRIFFIILYTMVIGPLFTVFTYFNIFRISYYYCLLFTLESIVFTILHYFTMKKNYKPALHYVPGPYPCHDVYSHT